jgi:phosphoribosylformylglycinamidine synthase
MPIRALILHANGSNRDREAAQALQLAGALPEVVHLNQLRAGTKRWDDYQLLVVPGGFSYADALGAGKLLALDLNAYFADEVRAFVESGRPVIGICNGFQALVKAGLLPGHDHTEATLTFNAAGRFECRWVSLLPQSPHCVWTRDLPEAIYCPVAHGEGNFVAADRNVVERLRSTGQVALVYGGPDGAPAQGFALAQPAGGQGARQLHPAQWPAAAGDD